MPILIQAREEDDSSIRRQAVVALGQIEGSDAVLQIGRRLKSDRNSEVRAAAARALGETGRRSAIRLLESALRDDVSVRARRSLSFKHFAIDSTAAKTFNNWDNCSAPG